ncbi:hypothetical protein SB782_36920, partial [Brevibacillus sp. SIMBA_076]|uniref:hypothetical protein n=1 Tax=Brevibacillus sp. SIMBA_076 TaxID=3085814 RepID=UPI00397B8374
LYDFHVYRHHHRAVRGDVAVHFTEQSLLTMVLGTTLRVSRCLIPIPTIDGDVALRSSGRLTRWIFAPPFPLSL